MKLITIYIPEELLKQLDDLIKLGRYPHRAEAIRTAIRDLVWNEHPKYKQYKWRESSKDRFSSV